MERGAIGESIPEDGHVGNLEWRSVPSQDLSTIYEHHDNGYFKIAAFFGPKSIRLERVALFLTTEQA